MKKLLAISLILSAFWLVSCNKDKEPTVAENKQTLESIATQMDEDMGVVIDDNGFSALVAFSECMSIEDPLDPPILKKKISSNKLTLQDFYSLTFGTSIDPGFNFQGKVGTYSWNATNQGWDITQNNPNDKIVINFPNDGPSGTVNDVTITIYNLEEVLITDDYDSWYQPTLIDIDLVYDGVKYIDLYFEASFNTSTGDPNSLSAELFMKPYTFTGSFNRNGADISLEFVLKLGNVRVFSVGGDLGFESSELDDLQDLSGYVQYRKVKLEGSADVAALDALIDPDADELNQYIDMTLYTYPDHYKIADVEFYYDETTESVEIQLVFTDGSTVPVEEYLQPILDALEQRLQEIEDEFFTDPSK